MSRSFNHQGPSIAIGSLPDDDPNATGPLAARIFDSPSKSGRDDQAGVIQYALEMDVAGTADVTIWVRDKKSGSWFSTVTQVAVANRQLFEAVGVAGAELFFQLTNPAGFATVAVRAESVAA